MKIYLMRHGETQWNKQRLLQGKKDIPLNENGIRLAQQSAEKLQQIPFDKVYASPLKRAYTTAMLVTGGKYAIETDVRLEEIGYGVCEGSSRDPGGENDRILRIYFETPAFYQPPEGGETLEALCARTWSFIRELAENPENAEKTVLVCSHGATIQSILNQVKGRTIADFWKERELRNCAVAILNAQNGQITIEQENVVFYSEM